MVYDRPEFKVVRTERLELSRISASESKPDVYTNFTTSALLHSSGISSMRVYM